MFEKILRSCFFSTKRSWAQWPFEGSRFSFFLNNAASVIVAVAVEIQTLVEWRNTLTSVSACWNLKKTSTLFGDTRVYKNIYFQRDTVWLKLKNVIMTQYSDLSLKSFWDVFFYFKDPEKVTCQPLNIFKLNSTDT